MTCSLLRTKIGDIVLNKVKSVIRQVNFVMNDESFTSDGKMAVREINLKETFGVLQRRWWIIVVSIIICGLLGGLYVSRPKPDVYASSARIILSSSEINMRGTMLVMIREPVVMERVIKELGLKQSPESLRKQIAVTSVDNSLVTLVTAYHEHPGLAARISNAVVEAFKQVAAESLKFHGVILLSGAKEDPNPVPVNKPSYAGLYVALLGGAIAGVGLIFVMDSLDGSIRSARELERLLNLPVLGQADYVPKREILRTIKSETIGHGGSGESLGT
ncbi:hypothetical protein J27TS7_10090 [Paenibacillus dendritiformis]|nr:hypothetical protein J27TS7_10090 [Paenibacillus dendritiformis]